MIVVFGSINLDIVTHVARIAGPGETVLGPGYARIPGGKGANQALAARRAGADVWLVGATGFDEFADAALSLLRADGVDLTCVVNSALPTGAAFISVDAEGQNAITVAAGANAAALASQIEHTPLGAGDILMLQREVPDEQGEQAARLARTRGARVVLNLAPSGVVSGNFLSSLDVLIMNEHEAADLAAGLGRSGDLTNLAAFLAQEHELSTVVTLGAEGAVGWERGEEHRVAAQPVTVVDTTAAGDTFAGAFSAALANGQGFGQALRRGVAAGSVAVTRHGAQPSIPTAAEIDAALAG